MDLQRVSLNFLAKCGVGTLLSIYATCLTGCSTPPRSADGDAVIAKKREQSISVVLVEAFENRIGILSQHKNTETQVFLRKLAGRLSASDSALREAPLGVFEIEDWGGKWHSFGLPGNRIYIPRALVREMEFENELAGVIAYELAHLQMRHVLDGMSVRQGGNSESVYSGALLGSTEFFGPTGVFNFRKEQRVAAAGLAIGLLYDAGYDPRGLIAFWETYRGKRSKKAPYDPGVLKAMLEKARAEIALRTPLRNPIVRSIEFLELRKKAGRL